MLLLRRHVEGLHSECRLPPRFTSEFGMSQSWEGHSLFHVAPVFPPPLTSHCHSFEDSHPQIIHNGSFCTIPGELRTGQVGRKFFKATDLARRWRCTAGCHHAGWGLNHLDV